MVDRTAIAPYIPYVAIGVGALVLYKWLSPRAPSDAPITADPDRTFTNAEVYQFADVLWIAFYGGMISEDEPAILAVVEKMNTNADVMALIEAYGKRDNGAPWPFTRPALALLATITAYLNNSERAALNAAMASKGITYAFP